MRMETDHLITVRFQTLEGILDEQQSMPFKQPVFDILDCPASLSLTDTATRLKTDCDNREKQHDPCSGGGRFGEDARGFLPF